MCSSILQESLSECAEGYESKSLLKVVEGCSAPALSFAASLWTGSWSAPSCAWPFFLTPWENQAPKGQMQQGFHGWWKLWLPSSPLHLNPLTRLNPGCGGVSALCNNKPVTGQVLQGQWDMIQGVMLGKCVVSISAEIWTLCRAPITEMIMMDICNCLVDEWQHN